MSRSKAILHAAYNISQRNKNDFFSLPELHDEMAADNSKLRSMVGTSTWSLAKEGTLKKGLKQGTYKLTSKGIKLVEEMFAKGDDWLRTHLEDRPDYSGLKSKDPIYAMTQDSEAKPRPTKSTRSRYTPTALGAIESIGAIIDQNEKLVNILRSINIQTTRMLEEIGNERDQSDL